MTIFLLHTRCFRPLLLPDPARRYYADDTSFNATVPTEDENTVDKTARLDLLWPTMYINSNDTKAVFAGIPLSVASWPVFRYFPGNELSAVPESLFACEGGDAMDECYDATARPWYEAAVDDDTGVSDETALGDVIVTPPYIDGVGSEKNWLVTIARAVYGDKGSASGQVLGVVGVDVLLEAVQESVEEINFLDSGYSILATAEEGVVLAAPSSVWDREEAEDTTTVCELTNGMCTGREWEDLLSGEVVPFVSTSFSDNGGEKNAILIAAPVTPTYDSETGAAVVTHYILSAVAREEIFAPSEGMSALIRESTEEILIVTVSVAAATLIAVAAAVCALSGSITRPIAKMTSAARSIAKDGAKTDVFGSVAATWGVRRGGSSTGGSAIDGDGGASRTTRAVDYLLCRGDDEISTLAREFSLMITGLGKRGAAARATGLEDSSVYPKNPFTTEFARAPPTAPSAPSAPTG